MAGISNIPDTLSAVCRQAAKTRFSPELRICFLHDQMRRESQQLFVVGVHRRENALVFSLERPTNRIPDASPFDGYEHALLIRQVIDDDQDGVVKGVPGSHDNTRVVEALEVLGATDEELYFTATSSQDWFRVI